VWLLFIFSLLSDNKIDQLEVNQEKEEEEM
jgi:hypothetical protein